MINIAMLITLLVVGVWKMVPVAILIVGVMYFPHSYYNSYSWCHVFTCYIFMCMVFDVKLQLMTANLISGLY